MSKRMSVWQISLLAIAVTGSNVAAVFKSLALPVQVGVRFQEWVGAASLLAVLLYLIALKVSTSLIQSLDDKLAQDIRGAKARRALAADGLPSRRDKAGD